MGHTSGALSYVGIVLTIKDLKKAFKEKVKEEVNEEDAEYQDSWFYESQYHDELLALVKKHNLQFTTINNYDEDDYSFVEICVYIWHQDSGYLWGYNACGQSSSYMNYGDFQNTIQQKQETLQLFMKDLDLDPVDYPLQMVTLTHAG